MARIPPRPEGEGDALVDEVMKAIRERGDSPSPLYRTLAWAPRMLRAWSSIAWPLRTDAQVSRLLRELIILRIAQLTQAEYEWAYHWKAAKASGATDTQVAELSEWRFSDAFTPEQKLGLAFAEEVEARTVTDEAFGALAAHFSKEECLELTITAAFYCCVSRVLDVLQIDPDPAIADAAPPLPR